MSAAKNRNRSAAGAVLEMRGVVLDGQVSGAIDLQLGQGEAAAFEIDEFTNYQLSAVLLGMDPPARGEIAFDGQDWSQRSVRSAEGARMEIGRVGTPRQNDCANWIQNLTVIENIALAQSIRPHADVASVHQRADDLAREFGIDGVPSGRPATTGRRDLAVAQWVRAFLPDPLKLLILECPLARSPKRARPAFLEAVAGAMEKGTSVVWIGGGLPDEFPTVAKFKVDHSVPSHP